MGRRLVVVSTSRDGSTTHRTSSGNRERPGGVGEDSIESPKSRTDRHRQGERGRSPDTRVGPLLGPLVHPLSVPLVESGVSGELGVVSTKRGSVSVRGRVCSFSDTPTAKLPSEHFIILCTPTVTRGRVSRSEPFYFSFLRTVGRRARNRLEARNVDSRRTGEG